MYKEQNTIERIYNNPKARGFFNHLVRSYVPISKTKKVLNFKEGEKHECSICGKKLFDIQSLFNIIKDKSDKILMDYVDFLKKQSNGDEINSDNPPIYEYIPKDSVQAWTGENTNTFLCIDCVED
ncbi:MAG TPA: hypothetical protein P5513_08610, partial [Candidatus Diapherotrites archaeon]|nr:hypothetical protein [Candidatus Diapherotrites archaeon]